MKLHFLDRLISKIPYLRYAFYYRRYSNHRPGHYYSPVVNLDEIGERRHKIWPAAKPLPGIDLNDAQQETIAGLLLPASHEIPFNSLPGDHQFRYHFDNKTYAHADGLVLFAMLTHFKPRNVIEVGSGFSSALMLDTNDRFFNGSIHFAFIEPNPEMTLNSLLRAEDRRTTDIRHAFVQDVDPAFFQSLQENDILLIDNSHVSKTGSDVNYLMTDILPVLNKGVLVHIHDIFYPFEYPESWLFELRLNWNEIYAVHNFLLFNSAFEIVFFSDYMQQQMTKTNNQIPDLFFKDRPGSLWIRKIK